MPTVRLKEVLRESTRKNQTEGMLFSGGLDTAILASFNPGAKAVTVGLWPFGEDFQYAKLLEKSLGLELYHKIVRQEEALEAIPEVIRILGTFDPAIPNDLAIYFGLKHAKELGIKSMMTGDGADEIFGGYDFMRNIDDLDFYIKKITKHMSFNSKVLGKAFEIEITQPFLDEKVIDFALRIPAELKIKKEKKAIFGKWILRKSFEKDLSESIIWQSKRPLEKGSGMSRLREVISAKISDEEFKAAEKQEIKFMNKEHYYYYKIYAQVAGEIVQPKSDEKGCEFCKGAMRKDAFHCKTCGGVDSRFLILDTRCSIEVDDEKT
ncbi:MAG: asparagine synthase C-terminal domain-containing protein [Candidatus Omnitrophota bacterium]